MKTLRLLVLFCSVLGLVGVFSDVRPAVAHSSNQHTETATAADVVSGDASLENFVNHAATHIGETATFGELTQLVTDFRTDDGVWKSGSTYLIILTSPGGGVQSHANNRELEDEDWSMLEDSRGNPVGQGFLSVGPAGGPVNYYDQTAKQSYAVESIDPFVPLLKYVLIGGFDYEPEIQQVPYDQIAGADTIIPPVTAEDVSASVGDLDVAKEKLKIFVQGAIDFFRSTLFDPNVDLANARKLFRAEDGPWRHVSTYIYIMDNDGNVIFNGGNKNIEQTNLLQSQDPTLVDTIQRLIAASEKENEDERFVNYNWDNPAVDGDSPPGGGGGGSSPKLGYVETLALPGVPQVFIFGSGLYLGSDTPETDTADDGACAIAGNGNTTQNTIFNLFLVMSVLFLAISFKRRSV